MMVHDNGKVCVLAMMRCGHTNMFTHFGLEPYTYSGGYDPWIQSTSKRVVVLRNPYNRVQSAIRFIDKIFSNDDPDRPDFFAIHSKPYMHLIQDYDFTVIDFYRISEYLERKGQQSHITHSNGGVYIPNDDYTKEDLEREYQIYCDLMNTRVQITPEEWKELTP